MEFIPLYIERIRIGLVVFHRAKSEPSVAAIYLNRFSGQ